MYRKVIQWISPDEADSVTNALFNIASQIDALCSTIGEIEQNYKGNSNVRKVGQLAGDLSTVQYDLKHIAAQLELKAGKIAVASVKEEVEEWVEDVY